MCSVRAECEIRTRPRELERQFPQKEIGFPFYVRENNSRCQRSADTCRPLKFRFPATIGCTFRLRQFARHTATTNFHLLRACGVPLEYFSPACPKIRRGHGSKSVSRREPFLQAQSCNLALLFGRFLHLSAFIIQQTALQNFKNGLGGLAGSTYDKNPAKALLVNAIPFRQGAHNIVVCRASFLLFFTGPRRGSRHCRQWNMRFADPWMTGERFHPIGLAQILPSFIRSSDQRRFIANGPAIRHLPRPGF